MLDGHPKAMTNAVELATDITIAWLANPNVRASEWDVPAFLRAIHAAIVALPATRGDQARIATGYVPAVPVRLSIKRDYIVSLIDGRHFKSLKRHLLAHGLTAKEYRDRYGLPPDYPMVAASYSAQRSEIAQRDRIGRKPRQNTLAAIPPGTAPGFADGTPAGRG